MLKATNWRDIGLLVASAPFNQIIWDFDGVIVDSNRHKGAAMIEVYGAGIKSLESKIGRFHAANLGVTRDVKARIFNGWRTEIGLPEIKLEQLNNAIKEKIENLSVEPEVELLLHSIQNVFHYIVTAAPKKEVGDILRDNNVLDYFVEIKSSQDKFEDFRALNLGSSVIAIGDGLSEYNAAKKMKIPFIAVRNKYNGSYFEKFQDVIAVVDTYAR